MNDGAVQQLEFLVGEEKRLSDIISRSEIEPLLRRFVSAGLHAVVVLDEDALVLAACISSDTTHAITKNTFTLLVEGEPKGALVAEFSADQAEQANSLALLAHDTLQLIITNNLKRMMTTEMHTSIVYESYEQLVQSNRQLADSELRYRELALTLEKQVESRTKELQQAYNRMLQQEKLAAVGSLAAGMAHEINNPNGFVKSNISTFARYFERLQEMLDRYRLLLAANAPLSQLQTESDALRKKLKIDFIISDIKLLIAQSLEGCERIASIVDSLKKFSHVDESGNADANLNDELDNLLAVIASQIPADGHIVREYGCIPLVPCNPGLLSQAFLNIIQNSLLSRDAGVEIIIRTFQLGDDVIVTISDNGCGIPEQHISRVFEPFFTTRDVGVGTGMGLTVAREIICAAGGTVTITSRVGEGTSVEIHLPVGKGC